MTSRTVIGTITQLIDRHPAAISLLTRLVTAGGSLCALPFIASLLTPGEQGFHYTFYALLAAQVFIELGLSSVLIQSISHEMARISHSAAPQLTLSGDPVALARLSGIVRFTIRWYAMAGLAIFALLATVGSWFLASAASDGSEHIAWLGPWVALSVAGLLMSWSNGLICLLEGFGQVGQAAAVRLCTGFTGSATLIIALLSGSGLWASGLQALAAAVVMLVTALIMTMPWIRAARATTAGGISWRTEILPSQWRIAVSFMSGWIIFQLMTPTVLQRFGAEEAGRFGLALALTGGIVSLSDVFAQVRYPAWGRFVAGAKWKDLDQDFLRTSLRSMATVIVLGIVLMAGVLAVPHVLPSYSQRIPDPLLALLLIIGSVSNQWAFNIARYLRAHRGDPFMDISVVFAVVMLVTCAGVQAHGSHQLAFIFMASSLIILTGWGTQRWLSLRRKWHQP